MKSFTTLPLIIFVVGLNYLLSGNSVPAANMTGPHKAEMDIHQDSMSKDTSTQPDSSFGSMDEEQADQIRVFVNTTLIIIIIAILILALTFFLIINRVRRTTSD